MTHDSCPQISTEDDFQGNTAGQEYATHHRNANQVPRAEIRLHYTFLTTKNKRSNKIKRKLYRDHLLP